MTKPIVALVGRPNVGKSTLFNRLSGERLAIIDETPGTTRDRVFSTAEWNGCAFTIIDTGGIDPEFGRRTPLSVGSAAFVKEIQEQALVAVSEADAVILVVDGETGITSADQEIADLLRRHQKRDQSGKARPPILVAVNKCETEERRARASEFYALGLGEPQPISALHGTETGDLLDTLVAGFPPAEAEPEDESVKIAIVGKPNAGKSSLLNRLAGAERAIVSPIPGTTRDAVDTRIEFQGVPITLIDTAGIRRRGKVEQGVEQYSVLRAMKAIERADVALLVIDATTGVTAQDAHIAGYILEEWKSCVVLINKWDAVKKDSGTADEYTASIRSELHFLDYVPILRISAKTGKGVDQVLPMALRVQEERLVRLSTSKINQVLQNAQDMHAHPSKAGKVVKLYYGTQVRSDPPTFMIYVNDPKLMHFSYIRYLENQLRAEYGFLGTPIRLVTKGRKEQ